jgi:alkylation response protein AidB-like acyl-CoA dehydrogenase
MMKNVIVPAENELEIKPSRYAACARTDVGAICLGAAQEAFDKTLAYLKERTKNFKPLASYGAVGYQLANMATELELARGLVYTSAKVFDDGGDSAMLSYMAKTWISEMAVRVISRCIELNGAIGVSQDTDFGMLLRDVQCLCVAEGSTNLNWSIIQNLMGIKVDYL